MWALQLHLALGGAEHAGVVNESASARSLGLPRQLRGEVRELALLHEPVQHRVQIQVRADPLYYL